MGVLQHFFDGQPEALATARRGRSYSCGHLVAGGRSLDLLEWPVTFIEPAWWQQGQIDGPEQGMGVAEDDHDLDAGADFDEEDQGETEEDLAGLAADATFDAVVVSTDWTAETLLAQIRRGNVELDPVFQRRDAWDRKKKSRFIESVIVGLPVPQIVLAERKGVRGSFLVLDGKQRLLTLLQYANGDYRLTGLELRKDLNLKYIDDLPPDDLLALETQTVRTVVVRNWQREEFLYLVFLRLNTGSVPLSPQELRQALHPGPFVEFVNRYTTENLEFSALLRRTAPDFRMRDVELLVRHFAFLHFLPDYNGNLKDLLDGTCARLNKQWGVEAEVYRRDAQQCLSGIKASVETFGDDSFRRWNDNRYERPFNRAVFDIMTFYARLPGVRELMVTRKDEVRGAFRELCVEDLNFTEALTTTTKSTDSIFKRLATWGHALENLGASVPIPTRARDGHIAYATF